MSPLQVFERKQRKEWLEGRKGREGRAGICEPGGSCKHVGKETLLPQNLQFIL